jgi:ClpP class serine protease
MDQIWLCELEALRVYCDKVLKASDETVKAAAFAFADETEAPSILSVDGETATIEITGTLRNRPSILSRFFGLGSTTYGEIMEAIGAVSENEAVKTVRLAVDSPGGGVTGLDEIWIALRDLGKKKRIVAENRGMMASAAYWIASAAHEIVATSPVAETGSIGVYLLWIDYTEADKKAGIKEIDIVSKNAPEKAPDAATPGGLKTIQERLNAIERVFIDRVAVGRDVTREKVEQDFGRGGLLIAKDPDSEKPSALSVGMIDSVVSGPGGSSAGASAEDEIAAGATSFKDLPVIDKPWDATAAIKRVRTKTGSTEKPSASYKNAFFWYDAADSENFGAYKLPFVDVDGGQLKAVRRGVFAAKGAMAGARGGVKIPASDRAAVNSHIDKYEKKIEKQDQEKKTAAAVNKNEGENMTFAELKAQHPELAAEIERMIAEAREAGAAEAKAEIEARNKATAPILAGEYPDKVKEIARGVLSGDNTEAELRAAVDTYDAVKESLKGEQAEGESAGQGDTPPVPPASGEGDGEIRSEEDHNAAVARFRQSQGLEA